MKLPKIQLRKKRERKIVDYKRKSPKFSFKYLTWRNLFKFISILLFIPLSFFAFTQIRVWQARAAATIFWDGGGNGTSWDDPLNWNTNLVPVPADDVLIDTNSTVNITEPITVNSLVIGKSAGNATSILQFSYDAITLGALTISGGDLTLYPGATITHIPAAGSFAAGKININVQTGNMIVSGTINADYKGFPYSEGPGQGVDSWDNGSGGGGYGGNGGSGQGAAGGIAYGSYLLPTDLGSGGGNTRSSGGSGGGAIKLTVAGTTTVAGTITANGQQGTNGHDRKPGGGSGGSVLINTGTLTGSGIIRANGGQSSDSYMDGGPGGGGRIALYYTTDSSSFSALTANGARPVGSTYVYGGAGTIYKKAASAADGDLIISNNENSWYTSVSNTAETPLVDSLNIDNIVISKYARVDYASTMNVASTATFSYNMNFTLTGTLNTNVLNINNNGWYYNQLNSTTTYNTINWTGGIISDNGGTFSMLSGGGALTIPATTTLAANVPRSYTSVIVNGTLTHDSNGSIEVNKINFTISGDFTLNTGAYLNVDYKGYSYSQGPGQGVDSWDNGGGGAGYGGNGGNGQGAVGGTAYGSYLLPTDLGSGGGDSRGSGGSGGGAVRLTVGGTTTIAGTITANGQQGTNGHDRKPGGGSGGSVLINTGTLTGSGIIRANGGQSSDSYMDGGPGGGGRIALYYTTDSSSFSALTANGARPVGSTYVYGGAGTIYKKAASATNGDLIISNNENSWYTDASNTALTPLQNSLNIDNLTVSKYARVDYASTMNVASTTTISYNANFVLTGNLNTNTLNITNGAWYHNELGSLNSYSSLNWTGSILTDNGGTMDLVSGGSSLTVPTGTTLSSNVPRLYSSIIVNGTLTHDSNGSEDINRINLTVSGDFTLNTGAYINVDYKGYSYSQGPGQGVDSWDNGGGGAGYGGNGGNGQGAVGGIAYGSYLLPTDLGSGGGNTRSSGGSGGGAIKLTVAGTTTVAGTITANGQQGTNGSDKKPGGGSGGSVLINTGTLTGSGIIRANGGQSSDSNMDGGPGGGGRIALYYTTDSSSFSALTANGARPVGSTYVYGGAGTIYKKAVSATNGDLIISNNETSWTNSINNIAATPLTTSLSIDNITLSKYSRVDYGKTMNVISDMIITDSSHFINTGTLNTNTLSIVNSSTYFNNLASTISYSSLNWTGGGIVDDGGSMGLFNESGDLTIPEGSTLYGNVARTFSNVVVNGTLSHLSNGSDPLNRIDYTSLGNFRVSNTGTINVDGKGYSYGNGPGAGGNGDGGSGGGAHCGDGGNGQARPGGIAYGIAATPDTLGSGGGYRGGYTGAAGGGAIKLTVAGTTIFDGVITANGGYGDSGNDQTPGGGGGGAIWVTTNVLQGTGNVRANGGNSRDWSRDGGGGGGGCIALYYAQDNSSFATLTVNGGTAGSNAQPGEIGSLFRAGLPMNPLNLNQFKSDGTTAIALGGTTNEGTMVLKFQTADADDTDVLTPEIEIQPLGVGFNNIATHTGNDVTYSGSILTASVTVDGLADGTSYHWQARACDSTDQCSNWVSAGNNTETEADIRVVMNTAPNSPTIPGSSYYIDGQYTNYLQPTFDFVLTDSNTADGIGYQIQIDTTVEFTTVVLDYISGIGAQGVQSFTVGQAVGEGTYNTGAQDQELLAGEYYWRIKSIDSKGSQSGWSIASGEPAFIIDLSKPSNATNTRMKSHLEGLNEYTESAEPIWFNRNDLYFEWDEGSDQQGVKGYCLYLGQNSEGNPATEKGLLGTSPLSTTGTTCDFITTETSIDFANSTLRSYDWLTSSNEKYYFKVKTIDIANNIYEGPDVTNYISFKFDNTSPQNVSSISAPSSTFSSTADMYFTWPISENNGGSDLHSQLLGFQYALNTRDTWYGDLTDETTGLTYKSLESEQPFYLPQNIRDLIQLGQNILYFRILDQAGNVSELRTVNINYGGEAPKFADGEQVTVTPTQSDNNSFAFSWPEAIVSEGNEIGTYYYMINTPPPMSYATITSNSATYIATTETTIAENPVNGLRKGANTIYVVAVDKAHNYSPTNTISATFHLNTELPDPPTNLIIADSSIKDVSMWRAALIWDDPVYKGTGSLTYVIQRSEDAQEWETIKTTTGLAHIDTVEESKPYYWRVGTMDNSDESISHPSYSNAVTIIPRGKYTIPPTLTSGPAASSITTTKATLSWTTNRTADSKIAFGLASGNYLEWEPSISTHTTEHLIPLSNLSPGTEYFYVAKWTDEDGNTGISDEQTFVTQPPPEVKEVRISNLGISSTIINFTTKNASKVKIYYGTSTSFGGIKEIGTSKLETSYSVEIDKLEDGTKYFYQINTFDEEGEEYTGTILDFQTLPRPKVSNILVQQVAKTALSTLLVTWESNTKISSVVTFYPEKNPELMQDIVELELVQGEHKMLVKGLLPDTVYILRVRGKDIIGNEAVSENIRITTSSDSRPPLISAMNIEGTNILQSEGTAQSTSSQLIVTWTTDEPSTSQVEYGEGSAESYSQLTQEDRNLSYNHVVIISGLTPSKVYHLRAISKDAAENESRSIDTVTITPKATDSAFYLVITTLQEAFNFLGDL